MPDDSPVEFRSSRSGLTVADWLTERNRRDAVIYTGAAALMLIGAVLATFATYGVAVAVLLALNAMTCGLWRSLVFLLACLIVAGLFVFQRTVDGDDRETVTVDAGTRGQLPLRLSRLTGNSWMMFLENPSAEYNSFLRVALNLLLLAPRLVRLSGRMWNLAQRLRVMDVATVGAGLDAMMQSGERMAIGALVQEFPNVDPQRFIGDLTLVDGVILLSSEPAALTVTPAVHEEFESWKKETRRKRRGGA